MEQKISTSVQYQFTNNILFDEIFKGWENFKKHLDAGPDDMKKYLFQRWNESNEMLKKNERLELKDVDKKVSVDDFNITFNKTQNGSSVFFFIFPDYAYRDAASKCVALAFTKNGPKYFTLEYSEHVSNHEPCWVIGEFYIDNGQKQHKNYGTVDNDRITYFAGKVLEILLGLGL